MGNFVCCNEFGENASGPGMYKLTLVDMAEESSGKRKAVVHCGEIVGVSLCRELGISRPENLIAIKNLDDDVNKDGTWVDAGIGDGTTLAVQVESSDVWIKRAKEGHWDDAAGKRVCRKESVQNALECSLWPSQVSSRAEGWFLLGVEGGGKVGGTPYSKKVCFQLALEADASHAGSWRNLGVYCGGGEVWGKRYSKAQCMDKSAALAQDGGATPRAGWFS